MKPNEIHPLMKEEITQTEHEEFCKAFQVNHPIEAGMLTLEKAIFFSRLMSDKKIGDGEKFRKGWARSRIGLGNEIRKIIVEDDKIDKYFPKGKDKRRGQVLVVLGSIASKILDIFPDEVHTDGDSGFDSQSKDETIGLSSGRVTECSPSKKGKKFDSSMAGDHPSEDLKRGIENG